MGYSMHMIRPNGDIATLKKSIQQYGSILQTDENLRPLPLQTAETSITYNYSRYFYEAAEGDDRFLVDGENAGIRAIYGKPSWEALTMLSLMALRIRNRYTNANGQWLTKEIKESRFFDEDGREIGFDEYLFRDKGRHIRRVEGKRTISEGDTSNYWAETAANAINALNKLIEITVNCDDIQAVWDGD